MQAKRNSLAHKSIFYIWLWLQNLYLLYI